MYGSPVNRVFLFGFSRRAYTIHVLAAFLYDIGLLPQDRSMVSSAVLSTVIHRIIGAAPLPFGGWMIQLSETYKKTCQIYRLSAFT